MPSEGWVPRAGVKSSSKLLSMGAENRPWVLPQEQQLLLTPEASSEMGILNLLKMMTERV